MNPARTGPGIAGGNFSGWWVYVLGDTIGAVVAVMLIGLVRGCPTGLRRKRPKGAHYPADRPA